MSSTCFLIVVTAFIPAPESDAEQERANRVWAVVAIACAAVAVAYSVTRYCVQLYESFKPRHLRDAQTHLTIWHLRDIASLMLLVPEHEVANKVRDFQEFDHKNVSNASKSLVNLMFGQQMGSSWMEQRVIAGSGASHWDHHARVASLLRDARAGRVTSAVSNSMMLREDLIKIAHKLYTKEPSGMTRVDTNKSSRSLYDDVLCVHSAVSDAQRAVTDPENQAMEASASVLEVVPRLVARSRARAEGLVARSRVLLMGEPSAVLSREQFGQLLTDRLEVDMPEERIDYIFQVLDEHETGDVSIAEFVDMLVALAPPALVTQADVDQSMQDTKLKNDAEGGGGSGDAEDMEAPVAGIVTPEMDAEGGGGSAAAEEREGSVVDI